MYELTTNRNDIRNELIETIRCFVSDALTDCSVNFTYVDNEKIVLYISVNSKRYIYSYPKH